MDIIEWVKGANINELHVMLDAADRELRNRSYVCALCGEEIPTARPASHPAHAKTCPRYASMVTY